MDRLAWLECQYRALVLREGQLLDSMLVLLQVGHGGGPLYAELEEELGAISRHQSAVARSIREALGDGRSPTFASRGAWFRPKEAPSARVGGTEAGGGRSADRAAAPSLGRRGARAIGSWPPVAS